MKRRLMIVNVYFAPDSFGGATIVAEQMAWRLCPEWDILVVTTRYDPHLPPLHHSRYRVNQVDVTALNLYPGARRIDRYMNPHFACELAGIIASFRPDAVHFHCIQGMGAEMLSACVFAGIPQVVTIHDNWWICERQFMINRDGCYCHQEVIDPHCCRQCLDEQEDDGACVYGSAAHRLAYLRQRLQQVDKVLFPSSFQRGLYKKNIPPVGREQFLVNKNGIQLPGPMFVKKQARVTRFGFVGGVRGAIKGFDLVCRAFSTLDPAQYELVVVDNTLNLGYSSVEGGGIPDGLNVRVVPAYTQETMDDFFAEIDVLLFPSQWKESFGLTVREALVRDIWVVCTDSGGTVEDIVDGENGTIIPMDGDWRSLRKTVEELVKKPLGTHVNPYKNRIVGFDAQAEELHGILVSLEK